MYIHIYIYYGDMNSRDVGRIVDVIGAILCLIVSPVIIERYEKKSFFSFFMGVDVMFE